MEIQKILTANILDIIFDGRNKAYGAYELRKTYNRRIAISFACTAALFAIFYSGYLLANANQNDSGTTIFAGDVILSSVDIPEDKKIIPIPPPPPPPQKPIQQIQTIQSTTPLIVKEANPEDMPPENSVLEDFKIDKFTVSGDKYNGITEPPVRDNQKDVISIPKKEKSEEEEIIIHVEIESTYPGGQGAWARYLNKNLANNYPEKAINEGIQGKVLIHFIVDKEGNVSDVKAVSGPEELRGAAIKVIRQSGKWIPAVQNGRNVKSYKMQPISFRLVD